MAGHSRSKNGVASLAYVPAIHVFLVFFTKQDVDARHKAGHDDGEVSARQPHLVHAAP
jgi:DNA replication and repair protein RecF